MNWSRCFDKACFENNLKDVKLALKYGHTDKNSGLHNACRGGHKDLVIFMIEIGANDWNSGLRGACYGGHKDLVYFMIEKGANDWNGGLNNACYGRQKDLALLMIEKGADDLDWAIIGASNEDNKELALFMIENGANINYARSLLSDDDILYLIHRGVTKFGTFHKVEKMWREWLRVARTELNSIIIHDLASIIASY